MTPKKSSILAIDDTPANLLTLGAALARDFDLQIATSGEAGLALATQTPPDIILLDIMMPDMDGFEVCRRLKLEPSLKDVPIVFVTALSEVASEAKGLALGAADYITKPINIEVARQRIRNLLEREHLRKEIEHKRDRLEIEITERKLAQQKLQLAASVFAHAREAIMITDAGGTIVDVNDAFTRITGYSRDNVVGQTPHILSSGRQSEEFYATLWHDLTYKDHWYGEIWNRRKNGEVYVEMQTISTVRDAQGLAEHYIALFSDITVTKTHQQQIEHIAHFDALTNLPNRVLLADRLSQGMNQAQRRNQQLAVAFLDLDGFKSINDRHGHEAGDQLLITLANRMKQTLREGDTLSRIGGDEFVAVLVDLNEVADCVPLLTRLLAAAAQPVTYGDATLQVSASLGVTFYPQDESISPDQLLRQADQAMYQAKQAGKNRYHVFDAELDRSVRGHHDSLERIRQALVQREFVIHYQPKVNLRTGVVVGLEALIRWQHPEKGLLLPALFLPLIEDHPLAVELGEWVMDSVLVQLEIWQSKGLKLPVSVNLGARQLQQADFIERLKDILAAHPSVLPSSLSLEILEASALEDMDRVSLTLEICRKLGVTFALDDFGTGYSSLAYLKRLPVSQLKIDQSFVQGMLSNPDDQAILVGIIGLARAFHREVIAEGVETAAHGALLMQLGCDLAQGFGIASPMLARDLPDWVNTWRPEQLHADKGTP